jgi:ABC-type sugar transport system substrate-binding protein
MGVVQASVAAWRTSRRTLRRMPVSAIYKKVSQAGIKLVFMDSIPTGLKQPEEYAAMISADSQGNGEIAAQILASCVDRAARSASSISASIILARTSAPKACASGCRRTDPTSR